VLIVFECVCELSVCEILDVCDVCVCVCNCCCLVSVLLGWGYGFLLSCFVSVLWFFALRWIVFFYPFFCCF